MVHGNLFEFVLGLMKFLFLGGVLLIGRNYIAPPSTVVKKKRMKSPPKLLTG